jgi:hypothetical protein
MKKIWPVLFFFFIQLSSLFAQNGQTVRGRIIDEASKAPIVGANIILVKEEGPLVGATADLEGYFKIAQIPLGEAILPGQGHWV